MSLDLFYKCTESNLPTVHRVRVGEAVVVGEQVALSILLPFLCNISFRLSYAAQTLVLSYQRLQLFGMHSSGRQMSKPTSPSLNW
jgi:hypothetical protein